MKKEGQEKKSIGEAIDHLESYQSGKPWRVK
jgi:hypothetical protein